MKKEFYIRIIAIVFCLFILLVLFNLLFDFNFLLSATKDNQKKRSSIYISSNYYEEDIYNVGLFHTYIYFNRYLYENSEDIYFFENTNYDLIGENVDFVKSKILLMKRNLEEISNHLEEINFDFNMITENDLYHYIDKGGINDFKIYYYDIESHILYEICYH